MNSFNKKINSMFICMCVFFLLPSIQLYYKNSNDLLFYITVWLTRIMAVIVLIKYFKKGTLSKYFCFVFLFFAYIVIDTLILKSDVLAAISQAYATLAIICFFEIYFKEAPKFFIENIVDFLIVIITFNCYFMYFEWYDFLADRYLFGIKNQLGLLYIIAVVLAEIERKELNAKLYKEIYLLLIIILSLYKAQSSNNLIAFSVMIVGILIANNKKIMQFINKIDYKLVYLFILGIDYAIVVLNIQKKFTWLIQGILHKNLTLTNRTFIWEDALYKISQHPIWGHGIKQDYNVFQVLDKNQYNIPIVNLSAHNQFLQTAYEGGIVALLAVIIISLFMINELNKLKKIQKESCGFIILMGYVATTIICFAEAPGIIHLFTYLGLINGYLYLHIFTHKRNVYI